VTPTAAQLSPRMASAKTPPDEFTTFIAAPSMFASTWNGTDGVLVPTPTLPAL
jgi:hypothetical protein